MERRSSCPALPVEFDAVDGATRAALAAADGAGSWGAAARAEVLRWSQRQKNVLAAIEAKVVNAEASAGTWGLKGDKDLPDYLNRLTRQGRGAGYAAVGRAATLAAMPQVADALVDGPVTPAHVQQISKAAAASPTLAAELATPEGQAQVIEMARTLDGSAFGRRLAQVGAALDPASRQREHNEQRLRRDFQLSHGSGGTQIKGFLDSIAGYKLAKAIEAFNPRPGQKDDRTFGMRQADALVALAEHALRDTDTTPGAVAPPQVVVTIQEETWTALRAARENANPAGKAGDGVTPAAPSFGSTSDVVAALRGVAPVVDEAGNVWPASEVGRLLCDCKLTYAMLKSDTRRLDLGIAVRLFTRAHWLALLARGQTTCAYPGCTVPLRWCELHHMTWWKRDGGRTDLANCAPYCSRHHGWIHDHDIRIRRLADGSHEHRRPDGRIVGDWNLPRDDGSRADPPLERRSPPPGRSSPPPGRSSPPPDMPSPPSSPPSDKPSPPLEEPSRSRPPACGETRRDEEPARAGTPVGGRAGGP